MRLLPIPAGTFWMGSDPPEGADNEYPKRLVETEAYEIGETPVTNAEFGASIPSLYSDKAAWSPEGWAWREASGIDQPRFRGDVAWSDYLGPDQPVVGVSWYEADAFARHRGLRLPTEIEWERAARGDSGRRFPWGDDWIPANAAHRGGKRHTLPVGSIVQNRSPHGLYDCAGNVWEWCADVYSPGDTIAARSDNVGDTIAARSDNVGDTIAARSADGVPSSLLRSARGGAWNAHPPQLRCASRNAWPPEARFSNLGFRVAR